MQYLQVAVAMARPYFLAGTVPLYLVGVLAAAGDPTDIALVPVGLGLGIVWAVQLLTHYYNEFHDLDTDRNADPSTLTGGSQALVGFDVPPEIARWLGRASILGAVVLTGILVATVRTEPLLLGVVGLAIVFGWAYSSPPIRLVARGFGELTVVVLAAVLVPLFGFVLQHGSVGPDLLPVVASLVPLTFAMNISTTLPDMDGDRRTGKRTLAVRLGARRVGDLGVVAFLLGCAIGTWTIEGILPGAGLLGLVVTAVVCLAGWRPYARVRQGDRRVASRLAVVVTTAYGTIVFGIGLVMVLSAWSIVLPW